ncbi:MAG: ArsR family transcriptional regulator [Mycobacteriaceae bacterium]
MGVRAVGRDVLADLSTLTDPVRRRLYDFVAGQRRPVRRDDAAAAAGISRTLAAYHLDRLAAAGLLAISYARPHGQTGPGAGRPAKHYEPVHEELSVSVPPRNYSLLARVLVDAVAADGSGTVRSAVVAAAEAEGRAAAAAERDLLTTLAESGYEPTVVDNGDIELTNCPFHQLAQRHTELVCGLNHALLRGTLAGRDEEPDRAELAPRPGRCCVVIHPAA